VIDELVGEPQLSAEEQIRRARVLMQTRGLAEAAGLAASATESPAEVAEEDDEAYQILYDPEPNAEVERVIEASTVPEPSEVEARLEEWTSRRRARGADAPDAAADFDPERFHADLRRQGEAYFARRN
jgi:hypothetical protein